MRVLQLSSVILVVAISCTVGAVGVWLGHRIATAQQAAHEMNVRGRFAQLKVALMNHHAATGEFPIANPAGTLARESWRVRLLQFMDLGDLHERIRLNEPWNSRENMALADEVGIPGLFTTTNDGAATDFALCAREDLVGDVPRLMLPVRADDELVLLVWTPDSPVHWLSPSDSVVEVRTSAGDE